MTRYYIALLVLGLTFPVCGEEQNRDRRFILDTQLTEEAQGVAKELERILQLSLVSCPQVFRIARTEFNRLAEDRQSPHRQNVCFYDTREDRICVVRGVKLGEDAAWRGPQVIALRRIILSHELAHAWQREHVLQKFPVEVKIDRFVLHAILEGHAQWVALQYADTVGMKADVDRIRRRPRNWADDFESQFIYEDGLKYWESRVAANPAVTLAEILADPKVSQRTIAYPGATPTDLEPIPKELGQLLENATDAVATLTDFVGLRALVMRMERFRDREGVCRAYEVSWRVVAKNQSAAVTRFETEETAQALFLGLVSVHKKQASVMDGKFGDAAIPFAGFSLAATETRPATRMVLIRDGRLVIEINDARTADTDRDLKTWIERATQRYRIVQPALAKGETP